MAVTVILPRALQPYAAYNERVPVEAGTVEQALQKLTERYTELRAQLPEDLAQPPAGYGIYRNSVDVRRLGGLGAEVRPGDRITIIVPRGDL